MTGAAGRSVVKGMRPADPRGVAPTSLEAYDSLDLRPAQAEVLGAIVDLWDGKMGPSDAEIAEALGWTINRIPGRRGELQEVGLIAQGGRKLNAGGRKVCWWRPVEIWEQPDLFRARAARAGGRP